MKAEEKTREDLLEEDNALRARLAEAEETLHAIRSGTVDAVVVSGPEGEQVYTLQGADRTYRLLVEGMGEGALTLTPDGTVLYCNRAFGRMLKAPFERIIGSSIHDHIAPGDEDAFSALFEQGREGAFQGETRLRAEDGTGVPAYVSLDLLAGDDGGVICMVVVDLSQQKQHEEIVASERLSRAILEQAGEAIVVCDENGRVIRVSRAAHKLCGRNPLRQPFDEAFPLQLVSEEASISGQDEGGEAVFSLPAVLGGDRFHGIEVILAATDDQPFTAILNAAPLLGGEGDILGCVVVLTDITEHKRMEQELVRLERFRALSEMSAGVSHNLNNILTTMLTPAQLLQRMTGDPTLLREVDTIIRSTLWARDLVHRLHLSTRGEEEGNLQPVQVNTVVQEAIQVTRPRWKDEAESRGVAIEVVTELEDVPPIKGTASGLHDIFVNLALNAADAMPEGGTMTIRTRAVEKGVQITVTDTGIGMNEAVRRRVFEPFFTTKLDVGSGLGLSMAHGAVTRWRGEIGVESAPGKGTTFTIVLPVWTGPVAQAEATVEGAKRHMRRARVLIVEDNEGVRCLLLRLLGQNHDVEAVGDGEQALEGFAPGKYDVALIDLGMPGMPGDVVAQRMRRADPALAAVLVTGWGISSV